MPLAHRCCGSWSWSCAHVCGLLRAPHARSSAGAAGVPLPAAQAHDTLAARPKSPQMEQRRPTMLCACASCARALLASASACKHPAQTVAATNTLKLYDLTHIARLHTSTRGRGHIASVGAPHKRRDAKYIDRSWIIPQSFVEPRSPFAARNVAQRWQAVCWPASQRAYSAPPRIVARTRSNSWCIATWRSS